jgi:hypothetical protein
LNNRYVFIDGLFVATETGAAGYRAAIFATAIDIE